MTTKRIASKTVTDTLADAMEHADRFKHVVIVAETHEGDEFSQMVMMDEGCTLAATNYLVDIVKQYLLTVARNSFNAGGVTPPPDDPEDDEV